MQASAPKLEGVSNDRNELSFAAAGSRARLAQVRAQQALRDESVGVRRSRAAAYACVRTRARPTRDAVTTALQQASAVPLLGTLTAAGVACAREFLRQSTLDFSRSN
jgi:hypothetical protein